MPEEGAAKETPPGTTPGWDGVHVWRSGELECPCRGRVAGEGACRVGRGQIQDQFKILVFIFKKKKKAPEEF